ncbi:hypothetical protein FA09DRAFT_339164 [Tilletiopsis washingtonensis]|uniref:RNA exonuclease 4 n=1 Tax=Tilletiopsis washingtonensis TaxID=58919 RepID=A0A316Z7C8_9BASI|nr:hypothetical protein FA09DRAFT_339164 [Tilletiopsis washingtonensis]PWN97670.1 hypothetical protein FA09DRAFT_339164 [Tilletiopsis washingtonensis]
MSSRPSTSAAGASTSGTSKPKPVKAGSNWKKLRKTLAPSSDEPSPKRRRPLPRSEPSSSSLRLDSPATGSPAPTTLPWFAEDLSPEDLALVRTAGTQAPQGSASALGVAETREEQRRKKAIILGGRKEDAEGKRDPGTYLAIDCEMVGVGPLGSESMLARVSLVNWHGHVVLDTFVRPLEKVTDYRTWVSGVRASDLKGAPTFADVQARVAALIKGRVLVGHAIQNDLKALLLSHPRPLVRDTATFKPLRDIAKTKHPALRNLARLVLGISIQVEGEEHSSVEDAQATMAVYRTQHAAWQKALGREAKGRKGVVGAGEAAGEEGEKIERTARKASAKARQGNAEAQSAVKKAAPAAEWWKE